MEKERQIRDKRDPFNKFGGFTASFFGGNPFNDPFLARSSGVHQNEPPSGSFPKGPVIHELNSEDEIEEDEENVGCKDDPFVDHPDDEPHHTGNREHESCDRRTDLNSRLQFHSYKVTYGGIDGAYYTSSTTRRMGDDGVLMEECKEADKTTGEAKHRISKGLHDKAHSLTRKLNSDGKVETQQTLHNLNEDEIGNFENLWRGSAGMYFPLSSNDSSMASTRRAGFGGGEMSVNDEQGNQAQTKKVVRINIE